LTYCIGAIDSTDQQVKDLAVCWNDFLGIFLVIKDMSL